MSEETPAKKTVAKKTTAKKPAVTARRPISKEEYARTKEVAAESARSSEAETNQDVKSAAKAAPVAAASTSPSAPKATAPKSATPQTATPSKTPSTGIPATAAVAAAKEAKASSDDVASKVEKMVEAEKKVEAKQTKDSPSMLGNSPDRTAVIPIITDDPVDSAPASASAASVGEKAKGRRRTLRRKLTYIEPWSVTKLAFVTSVALMIVMVVAVITFWFVLQVTGIWQALNDSILNVLSDGSAKFDVNDYVGLARITGFTLIVSAFNVVFFTAFATILAHLYNLAASLMGGVEVTFEERNN